MSIVSIVKTKGNEYADIKKAVDEVIKNIGGLEDVVKPGDKVIIKPNLVATPTDRLSGGVTRWEVCLAIYEALDKIGAEAIIAESAAAGADTEAVIQKCGYQELRDKGIPVIDLKNQENKKYDFPVKNGKIVEKLSTWEIVKNADVIITVPVMKTHDQTEVTLGMKNCKGLISDINKKKFHTLGLVEGVCDIIQTLKPAVEIIDGTFGQQGLGPIFGETKEMDLIIGSKDLVACEAVTSKVMGYEVDEVGITVAAYNRGLGEKDISKIQVIGEQIESVKSRFKRSSEVEIEGIPDSYKLIFSKEACTGCKNTVISSLMDMKDQNLFSYLENMNVIVGPCTEKNLPEGSTPENTVCIGICTKALADEFGFRYVIGCPPGNVDTVRGILGDRLEYGERYK
ncbi:MAG: DUF362 domain-containing protein [Lachnospiraceae bacterium]